jgi:hypothetical protein
MDNLDKDRALNVGRIDHVAFAFSSPERQDQACQEFSQMLGLDDWDEVLAPERSLRVLMSWGGCIELVAPTGPGSILDEFLEKNGEGFFTLTFGVEKLEDACAHVERLGRSTRRTGGHPSLSQRFDVFKQSIIEERLTGGMRLVLSEHRGFTPKPKA